MKQLIWKEIREKRLWFVPLLASTLGVIAFGNPYVFWNYADAWILVSGLVALLLGLSTYSGEIAGGTVEFLYSRGVSWKKVLAAKLIIGLGMLIATAVISAIVFRLTAPQPYVRFLTPAYLLTGTLIALEVMGAPYLIGAGCSVLLPGIFGSILVLAVSVGAGVGLGFGFGYILHDWVPERFLELYEDAPPFAPFAVGAVCLGLILAAVLTARFGLSLTIGKRAARYAFVVLVVGVCLSPLDPFVQAPFVLDTRLHISYSVSPSGEYAVGVYFMQVQPDAGRSNYTMIRLSDRRTAILPWPPGLGFPCWVGPETVAAVEHQPMPNEEDRLVLMKMTRSLKTSVTSIHIEHTYGTPFASPDGRLAAMQKHFAADATWGVTFVDLEKGRKLGLLLRGVYPDSYWWQSNTEFGYVDAHRARHIVRVR